MTRRSQSVTLSLDYGLPPLIKRFYGHNRPITFDPQGFHVGLEIKNGLEDFQGKHLLFQKLSKVE